MMKLRPFELVLVTIFAVLGLLALTLLSTYKPPATSEAVELGNLVVIWGTVPAVAFKQVLDPLVEEIEAYRVVQYVEKDARTFDTDILNALAENRGPDIVFIPHEKLVAMRNKIQPLPYDNFPLRDFRDSYIDGAEIFTLADGVYAFPVAIDPLVMYYNRDLFNTKNIIAPPATWEAVINEVVPALVERDFARTIIRSPLAFGEYRNVQNGFGIISMLLLQGGSDLVKEEESEYQISLNQAPGGGVPFQNALTFYTNFASPSNPLYSWNRAQDMDRSEFLREDLALYFGKGSEARSLASQNPNLNFDVAEVPQGASATIRRTYGSVYGLALLRSSVNKSGAYTVLTELGSAARSHTLSQALGMAPAHRATLLAGSNDKYGRIIYNGATVARGWLNPDQTATEAIFTQMVEDVLANRRRPSESVVDAIGRLEGVY
jgi:multiple sugar transport system substrate-binding protein